MWTHDNIQNTEQLHGEMLRKMAAADAKRLADSKRYFLPSAEDAATEYAQAFHDENLRTVEAASARAALDRAEAAVKDAGATLAGAQQHVRIHTTERDRLLAAADAGDVVAPAELSSANAACELGERRVQWLTRQHFETKAALAQPHREFEAALHALRISTFDRAVADAQVEMVPIIDDFVKAASQLAERLRHASKGVELGQLLRGKRFQQQVLRSIAESGLLPDRTLDVVGGGMKSPATLMARHNVDEDVDLVDAVVVVGERYGDHPAGSRVRVTAEELALQSRRDPISDRRLGALVSLEEYEHQECTKLAAINAPREETVAEGIMRRIHDGMEAFTPEGRARLAAREETTQRDAKMLAGLERLAAHHAFESASNRATAIALRDDEPGED